MAKLKAPLLSLGASGAIGKSLVFFGWKGLDVVREYVVPANPKSSLQVTQRGYLTACVAKIHSAMVIATNEFKEKDKTANALWGSTYPTPRTWFNQICKMWIDCKRLADIPIIYRDGTTAPTLATGARMTVYLSEETNDELAAGKFWLGTSKTAMLKSKNASVNSHLTAYVDAADDFDDLVAGTKYYWQFRPASGDPCEGAYSGIYSFVAT